MSAPASKLVQTHPDDRTPALAPVTIAGSQASSVLSTLNDDGSRRWLRPRLSKGRFLTARRLVAYVLIAIFALMPLTEIHGRPLILLDIVSRRFHIFGATFYPTDTFPLALLLVGSFLSIFWVTALLGRIWCGWACPQTVYMEFLFRPIERLFEGSVGKSAKAGTRISRYGKPLKHAIYCLCAFVLAHLFLAYFVPWSSLRTWVFGSPLDHPIGFVVVLFVTGAIVFDFGYFREQVCLVACPYGRFQSVLLDRFSMIVNYDRKRGEPRGRKRSAKYAPASGPFADVSLHQLGQTPTQSADTVGDCVDCSMCVTTCPTGIDIRNGLQMECIGCAQCIDACDSVMDKLDRPRGLIRYSSQEAAEGAKFRVLRPRVLLYPCVIAIIGALFTFALLSRSDADITVMRGLGQPFSTLPDTQVRNTLRVKIVNRLDHSADFSMSVVGIEGARLLVDPPVVRVGPGEMLTVPAEIDAPPAAFHAGHAAVTVLISGPNKFECRRPFTLLGPTSSPADLHYERHEEREHEHKEGDR
jgi:cytochrome c oxidase accessory protein FixG